MLQRIRTLAQQSANGSNSDDDRKALQKEVDQLGAEIDRISRTPPLLVPNCLMALIKVTSRWELIPIKPLASR